MILTWVVYEGSIVSNKNHDFKYLNPHDLGSALGFSFIKIIEFKEIQENQKQIMILTMVFT